MTKFNKKAQVGILIALTVSAFGCSKTHESLLPKSIDSDDLSVIEQTVFDLASPLTDSGFMTKDELKKARVEYQAWKAREPGFYHESELRWKRLRHEITTNGAWFKKASKFYSQCTLSADQDKCFRDVSESYARELSVLPIDDFAFFKNLFIPSAYAAGVVQGCVSQKLDYDYGLIGSELDIKCTGDDPRLFLGGIGTGFTTRMVTGMVCLAGLRSYNAGLLFNAGGGVGVHLLLLLGASGICLGMGGHGGFDLGMNGVLLKN